MCQSVRRKEWIRPRSWNSDSHVASGPSACRRCDGNRDDDRDLEVIVFADGTVYVHLVRGVGPCTQFETESCTKSSVYPAGFRKEHYESTFLEVDLGLRSVTVGILQYTCCAGGRSFESAKPRLALPCPAVPCQRGHLIPIALLKNGGRTDLAMNGSYRAVIWP